MTDHCGISQIETGAGDAFERMRPRLIRLAYRMLGSIADAEDVVQEAWLRWHDCGPQTVRRPAGFLQTVVTRLCLNELKSARRRRETYVGPWLPEPIVDVDPQTDFESDDITLPLMIALERLSALERAAFLLHDVFAMSFDEISTVIGRKPAACRKLASRARAHIHAVRPRFTATREQGLALARAFYEASRGGDLSALRALLSEDVTCFADGGGNVPATHVPQTGIDDVMTLFRALARFFRRKPSRLDRYAIINGLPGFVTFEAGGHVQTTALEIRHGKIHAIYVMRNPEKLRHLTDQDTALRFVTVSVEDLSAIT